MYRKKDDIMIHKNDECKVYCYTHQAFSDNTKGRVMVKEGDHVTNFSWGQGDDCFEIYSHMERMVNGRLKTFPEIDPFFGLVGNAVFSMCAIIAASGGAPVGMRKRESKLKVLSKDILKTLREMLYKSPYIETHNRCHWIRTRGTFLLVSKATRKPYLRVTIRPNGPVHPSDYVESLDN